MRVVMRPISKLKPYEMNPRINDAAVEAVARSIQEFGFRQPIVVDANDVIICGHTRWKAALVLGIKQVPVHVAKDLTPKQVRAYRIADNKLAEVAEWDMELLPLELVDLQSDGVDLGLLGFSDDDLAELFGDITTEGETDPDAVPNPPKKPKSKLGKLYQLGDHRVLCGDATKAENVERLMDGAKANMVFTDPPYGISYSGQIPTMFYSKNKKGKPRDEISGDVGNIYKDIIPILEVYSTGCAYIFCGAGKEYDCLTAIHKSKMELISTLIWNKPKGSSVLGANYKPTFEMFYYCSISGDRNWCGASNEWTIWELQEKRNNKLHPTQKPVELPYRAIKNHKADIILDPFLGSGTTLIAAEQLGRTCYGIEIEPRYVDVVRRRWAEFVHGKGCNWVKLTPEVK